ncbi:transglycosylase SLT domain-containing protein [Methylopila sp. 73B]|uniref:lytic transglycosylase domain-containing protein n=1 Tax=Methylopila sp. 73B TaxID=1120792 RepID=UPI00037EA028|nr:transglycosylase SLT domain-containing protein [Methylopila sp. 73B]
MAAGAAAFTSARSAGSPSKGGGLPMRAATPVPAQAAAAPVAQETRTTSRKAVRQARVREVAKTRRAASVRQASTSRAARRAAALASKTDTVALQRDVELPDAPKPGAEASAANLPAGSIPSMVTAMARAQGVSPALAHAVVKVESRYRPNATGRGGYIGLMQLSYQTAKGMGFRGSRQALYEPRANLTYGMKYLAGAVAKSGGNTCAAVSKYQGGHGVRGVTRAGAVYCAKVKRFMAEGVPASGRQTADAAAPQSKS